jgi:hypothetical protein
MSHGFDGGDAGVGSTEPAMSAGTGFAGAVVGRERRGRLRRCRSGI